MTVPFRAADSARWTSGTLVRGDANATLSGVVIDSRTVRPGQLFVAIVGPNHDAHRFLPQVVAAGAEFKTLAVNVLDDSIDASPAVVGNTLILRGKTYLYCIAAE